MKIAVAGGTGLTGRLVVSELEARGHEPVILARSTGVDLSTGAGLGERLIGVDALIDVTNTLSRRASETVGFFEAVGRTLLGHRIAHHVALSIVGIDRVDDPYYRGKLRQEALIRESGRPATIVRATQFHEFAGQMLDRLAVGPIAPAPRMRVQPVAVREVAARLVAAAEARPGDLTGELAGPRVEEMPDLVRRLVRARGRRQLVVAVPVPGPGRRPMARGGLLPGGQVTLGHQDFAGWLASEDARPWL